MDGRMESSWCVLASANLWPSLLVSSMWVPLTIMVYVPARAGSNTANSTFCHADTPDAAATGLPSGSSVTKSRSATFVGFELIIPLLPGKGAFGRNVGTLSSIPPCGWAIQVRIILACLLVSVTVKWYLDSSALDPR